MREAHGVAGMETAGVGVATSRDTVVAAADGDKRLVAENTKKVAVAAVVCSREPRH
jgi:CBS domain-containing protein